MGDGFLATFEGPARGVHCARAIARRQPLGIEVRAGLHTGEIDLEGDDIAGIAVAIGARIGAMAGPSEVLGLKDREGPHGGQRSRSTMPASTS